MSWIDTMLERANSLYERGGKSALASSGVSVEDIGLMLYQRNLKLKDASGTERDRLCLEIRDLTNHVKEQRARAENALGGNEWRGGKSR